MTIRVTVPRRRRVVPAMLAVAALIVGGVLVVRAAGPDDGQIRVTAQFVDASPLVAGNKVQLRGVEVGSIASVDPAPRGADVVLALNPSTPPLHADATARIEPVSLLGERFIDLDPGTPSAPLMARPLVIPLARTSAAIDVDDLISTFDRSASTGAAGLVGTLGEGIAHQGDNVARSLATLPPALNRFNQVAILLDQQNTVLNNLVVSAEKNATALEGPLDSLVDSTQRTLGVVAAHRRAVDGGLRQLPATLDAAQRALIELRGAADNTAGVLSNVRPLTEHLVDTSRELHGFADAAKPALETTPELLREADRLFGKARPVVDQLGLATESLKDTSRSLNTLRAGLLAHPAGAPSGLEGVMSFVANWALSCAGYDGLGHFIRFKLAATPSSVLSTPGSALPPLADTRHDPFNPAPPNPSGPDRSRTTSPFPLLPSLPNPDGPDNASHTTPKDAPRTDSGGASGLSRKQESDMFGQLMGGE